MEKHGTVGQATDDNIARRMDFACRIKKATNTHSEYATLIAFQRQQWLRERATIYAYTYSASYFNQNWSVPINFKHTCKYLLKPHEYSFSIVFVRTDRETDKQTIGEISTDAPQGWELA